MNTLPMEKKVQIIDLVVKGYTLQTISRFCDVSINTVTKLMIDIGRACEKFQDQTVNNIRSRKIQIKEIWSFADSRGKDTATVSDNIWTWTSLDTDSNLILSWYIAYRDAESAHKFISATAARVCNKTQVTIDKDQVFLEIIEDDFNSIIDYEKLIQKYGAKDHSKNYECYRNTEIVTSDSDEKLVPAPAHMNCMVRPIEIFTKRFENYCYVTALHFVYYNFIKVHKSLGPPPAIRAGLIKQPMTMEDLINIAPIEAPKKRGPYNKRRI